MHLAYIVIPLLTIITASTGSFFTSAGMAWYKKINLPSWTPAGSIIGTVWTTIFILATISAVLVWLTVPDGSRRQLIMMAFVLNAVLNILWSYLFFYQHLLWLAVWEAGLLALSVLVLIILIWPYHKLAAGLLLPYVLWVSFATYLTYSVARLN